ncbi:MAG TPA: ABC transporter ATP-binding protein, partial [Micromonosporaceae bacterium]|nr:ABC transporter ATP-binding protein [Micromonosporaceae bacterium]
MSAEARVEWRLPVAGAAAVRRATWLLIRADGRAMALVLLLNCLAAGTGLAAPWLLGRIVNAVSSGAPVSVVDSTVDRLALAVVGFAVAQPLLIRFARYAGNRFGERAACRLREDFVDRVLALPTSVVERAGTGDLTTRTSTDVAAVSATLRDAAPEVLLSTVQALFIYGAVFALSPLLGLIAFAGLPVLVGVTRWYLKRARGAYLAAAAAASDLAESLAGTAEGARAVEAFGLGRRRVDVVDARADASRDARVRTLYLRSVLFPVADLSHALPISLMLFAGGTAYIHHLVSLGAVVAAALYMWQIVDPLDRVLALAEQVQSSGASMARISGVAGAAADPPPAADVLPADDRVEVVDVHFAYTPGHDVLAGVDLAVRPGERLAMVGPSGAGKSTLGRLLAGLDRP